ncbi:MAG: homocysteine methyltransferase [Opitutaceae bacterium]|jgi:5-methyltetrahydrofolate--homocysteine methyltransferase|nr:homocysteine methyltransferase [Opitutaceae bacterium]
MPQNTLLEAIASRRLVCDGGMGTQLMLAGLEQGGSGEAWNISHPERILEIQKRYVDAGADCIISNTFGASRLMLKRHGVADDLVSINASAIRIAREAFGDREGYVLGDMGPLGAILEPYGELPYDEAVDALTEQAKALVEAGADALIIETQTGIEEVGSGIEAAKAAGASCIIASLAYDLSMDGTFYKTMMGVSPEAAAEFIEEKGADIVALNCGTGMDMAGATIVTNLYRETCDLPVMIQPNAGLPVLENMKAVYKQPPDETAAKVPDALAAGARIIGSCCGSTPDHTRAIRAKVDAFNANQ